MTDLRFLAGGADRIVVVDTETTGVYSSDRVVELALVTLSLDGELLDVWESLVHPERDVGPTHIHGITASMVVNAPAFGDIAGDVAVRLQGACIAAHNLPFDRRLLSAEFGRLGAEMEAVSGVDTLAATSARLGRACELHAIRLEGAHRARNDALATCELLRRVGSACAPGSPASISPRFERSSRVLRREDTGPVQLPDPPLIAYLASRLPHDGVRARVLAYLELLGRAITDLHLDPSERDELATLARDLGLDDAQIAQAHRRFVNELTDAALADDELTSSEYEVLLRVSAALSVAPGFVERRTRSLRSSEGVVTCVPGAVVAFTGDHGSLTRETLLAHAQDLGLTVGRGVTKQTALLVAADPATVSGKARKARRYGIPIVAADDFATAGIGHPLSTVREALAPLKVVTCPDCLANWTVPATSAERNAQRCDDCQELSIAPASVEFG